jgi:hypothetical protein
MKHVKCVLKQRTSHWGEIFCLKCECIVKHKHCQNARELDRIAGRPIRGISPYFIQLQTCLGRCRKCHRCGSFPIYVSVFLIDSTYDDALGVKELQSEDAKTRHEMHVLEQETSYRSEILRSGCECIKRYEHCRTFQNLIALPDGLFGEFPHTQHSFRCV